MCCYMKTKVNILQDIIDFRFFFSNFCHNEMVKWVTWNKVRAIIKIIFSPFQNAILEVLAS